MAEAGYSGNPQDCFKRNGDKLFIADNCKNNAVKSLCEIIKSNPYSSHLIIVKDGASAAEFANILSPVLGGITVIDGFASFKKCLEAIGVSEALTESGLIKKADEFKKKYSGIIITAEDENGEPLLNRVLCKRTSISGVYKAERSQFCISDLIAECRYDFVAADDIYGLIPFSQKIAFNDNKDSIESNGLSPVKYDIIDFLGVRYFFDAAHSYKRLKNIVSGSKGCVIISDLIFNEDAAGLYAVLSLLSDNFSYYKSRDFVTKIQSSYDTESEALFTDINFCLDDNSIMSACLRMLKGNPQLTPSSTTAIRDYFVTCLDFMSQEEILLKAVHSYAAAKPNAGNIDGIIKKLADSTDEMARCFCGMFFNDALKAEFESKLGNSSVSRMSAEEFGAVMQIFNQYGVYGSYSYDKNSFNVLRFCRDDSGFADFVRRNMSEENYNALQNTFCYSVTDGYGALSDKCVALAGLLDGRDKNLKFASPLLIVSDTDFEVFRKTLASVLPDYTVKNDINCLTQDNNEKLIVAVSSSQFRRTALWLKVRSVAFFDFLTDVSVLRILVNKALSYGNVKAVLTTDYSGISGHLADIWQNNLLTVSNPVLPVGISEVPVKENSSFRNYGDILDKLDAVYSLLCAFATNNAAVEVKETAVKYCNVLNEFSLKTHAVSNELISEFKLIRNISKNYEGIFKNSVSIGNGGDKVNQAAAGKNNEGDELIFFNTCIRYLRRTCNIYEKDCANCAEYSEKYIKNNSGEFRRCADAVFQSAADFYEKTKTEQGNVEIWGGSKDYGSIINSINASREKVNATLRQIENVEAECKGPFSVPYRIVSGIRDEAHKIYSVALKKYYVDLTDIFQKASDELLKSFNTVNAGF